MKVGLVGCCKRKLDRSGPAREVYASIHFKTALAWSERFCDVTFIASTGLGLLTPDDSISPYSATFSTNSAALRGEGRLPEVDPKVWATAIVAKLKQRIAQSDELVFLCGRAYWSPIIECADLGCMRYRVPFDHRLATKTSLIRKELSP